MIVQPIERETEWLDQVHALALRGDVARLPAGGEDLLRNGLVQPTFAGFELTMLGHRRHRAMLDRERVTLDLGQLALTFGQIPQLARRLRRLRAEWERDPDTVVRVRVIGEYLALVARTERILHRSAAIAPRFADYLPRLRVAATRLRTGEWRYAVDDQLDSIDVVWRELHEDCLQTLGRAHDTRGDDL